MAITQLRTPIPRALSKNNHLSSNLTMVAEKISFFLCRSVDGDIQVFHNDETAKSLERIFFKIKQRVSSVAKLL